MKVVVDEDEEFKLLYISRKPIIWRISARGAGLKYMPVILDFHPGLRFKHLSSARVENISTK